MKTPPGEVEAGTLGITCPSLRHHDRGRRDHNCGGFPQRCTELDVRSAVVARLEVQHGALRHVRRRQELERLTTYT